MLLPSIVTREPLLWLWMFSDSACPSHLGSYFPIQDRLLGERFNDIGDATAAQEFAGALRCNNRPFMDFELSRSQQSIVDAAIAPAGG